MERSMHFQRAKVFLLTVLGASCFLAIRKPAGVVKQVLRHEVAKHRNACNTAQRHLLIESQATDGWAPFNGDDGELLLGLLDSGFLLTYALVTIFFGGIGDRVGLRHTLILGLLGSGTMSCASGMAYFFNVHSFWYFLLTQIANGVFQSIYWPCCIAIMSNWFGKDNRGSVLGFWCALMSLGDISGTLSSAFVLKFGWGWSFVIPGLFAIFSSGTIFLFLQEQPDSTGVLTTDDNHSSPVPELTDGVKEGMEDQGYLQEGKVPLLGWKESSQLPVSTESPKSISLLQALLVPGVLPYAISLFFSKFTAFSLTYWLPFYMANVCFGSVAFTSVQASNMSILYDVGGLVGEIVSGAIADATKSSGITTFGLFTLAGPVIYAFFHYGTLCWQLNACLLLVCGSLVKGAYTLISSSVSANLGHHPCLQGNIKSAATVTALVGGIGSLGSALGPSLVGHLFSFNSNSIDVSSISWSLSGGMLIAGVVVATICMDEVRHLLSRIHP